MNESASGESMGKGKHEGQQTASDGQPIPPIRFGPKEWNLLYYAILIFSLLVGLVTFVSGASVADALLRFLVTLFSSALLGISFLSFVVMPLHMKHYEALIKAQKEAARRKRAELQNDNYFVDMEEMDEFEPEDSTSAEVTTDQEAPLDEDATDQDLETIIALQRKLNPNFAPSSASGQQPVVEDQASSLRRMVAATN